MASAGANRERSYPIDDSEALARTGKSPVLLRIFDFWALLGLSILILSTWLGAFALLGVGLENGGSAGVIYQYVIVWAGNLATFATLAELASMAPTAGGQYHWTAMLAPRSCSKLLSFVTGWLTVCGWQAGVAASAYVAALLWQGFVEVVDLSYMPELWQATLFMYAALLAAVIATTVFGRFLAAMERVLLAIYVAGFVAILIPLAYFGPHANAREVLTTFSNDGGWSSQGLSFCVGISGNAFALLGADSVYHMSEEVQNAATTVPRVIVWSIFLNGFVGLVMYIAVVFTAGDLHAALDSKYSYPFIEVLLQALNSRAGAAAVVAVIIVIDLGAVLSIVAAASRMLWSFARDRGVPYWRNVSKVSLKSAIPLRAIALTVGFSVVLGVISIKSPVAFNDVISLTVVSLYASALLLYRRTTGSIHSFDGQPHVESSTNPATNLAGSEGRLTWGPWRVPEPFGTIVNVFACLYLMFVFIFSFFPPVTPVAPDTMNYACLVFGSVMIMSVIYYFVIAHRVYKGPVVDDRLQQ